MYRFNSITNAASFAMCATKPAFVFNGSVKGYVVAIGRDARELIANGHKPLTLSETAKLAR